MSGVIGAKEVRKLPDPFEAKCPMCQHLATYPKSSIQALSVTAEATRQ
jgi:hypothetical protein